MDESGSVPGIVTWWVMIGWGFINVFSGIYRAVNRIGIFLISLANWLPLIIFALMLGLVAFPWQYYHDKPMESAEYVMRCVVRPFLTGPVGDLVNIARRIYNPLICWWNAANWLTYGIWREVVFPLFVKCDLSSVISTAAAVLERFASDFVADYIATGNFLTLANGVFDWGPLCDAWVAFWGSWQALVCCMCNDLCKFFALQPLVAIIPIVWIPVFPNPLAFFGSNQIGDPQFWCFFGHLFNAVMNVFQQLWLILIWTFTLFVNPNPGPFPRPDMRTFANLMCASVSCLIRSIENAAQQFVECYLPFPFNFIDFFCIIDTAACIIFKTFAFVIRILANIDTVVFYPATTTWLHPLKDDMKEILNLYGPLRYPPWVLTDAQIGGQRRLTECICIFIDRLMCDPTNSNTACFDPGAQNIIGDFDICCFINEALITAVDIIAGLAEMTYHIYSAEAFFRFIDVEAYMAFDTLKIGLVFLVDCLGKALLIIPVVGFCLRNLLVTSAKLAGCVIIFAAKLAISILTLGYFIAALDGEENWLLSPTRALLEWEGIMRLIVVSPENTPQENVETISNALCCLINRIPIPPLPCTNCIPGGWLDINGSPVKRNIGTRRMRTIFDRNWDSSISKFTPPLTYSNETGGLLGVNPAMLLQIIKDNVNRQHKMGFIKGPMDGKELDRLLNEKSALIQKKFAERKPDSSNRKVDVSSWAERYQKAIENRDDPMALHEFKPKGVTLIQRFDLDMKNKHFNEEGKFVGEDQHSGLLREVDERMICTPTPTCFDLCCIIRNGLAAGVQALIFGARFLNGLFHGAQTDFIYFKGPDFEMDIRKLIVDVFNILQCVCNFIELVFPVPSLDVCCAILAVGDMVSGILGVIINGIKSMALDPNFDYFTNGMFESDVDLLFDLTLKVVVCLCDILRAVLPIPGLDVCCIPQVSMFILIETARLFLQLLINLGTIETTGQNYFQGTNLNEIGMVKQFDVIIDLFFGVPGGQCSVFTNNSFHGGIGSGGLIACFCGILSFVIPARPCPELPIGDTNCHDPANCPTVDLCCLFRETGFIFSSLLKFSLRLVATIWQPWVLDMDGRLQPQVFIQFLFCDENQVSGPMYSATCGKLEPTLAAIRNLIADCPCTVLKFLDQVLMPSAPGCFCSPYRGIFQTTPDLIIEIVRQVLRFVRSSWSKSYWAPNNCYINGIQQVQTQCSWAYSVFAPLADRFASALISLTCLLDFFLQIPCGTSREMLIGSLIIWSFEILIRAVEFIEGLVQQFKGECNANLGGLPSLPGVNAGCLAGAIEGILSLPIDILIADGLLPYGENSQLDDLLDDLPIRVNGNGITVRVSGILTNISRYLECLMYNLFGSGAGEAMHGLTSFIAIIWQIARKLVGVAVSFINLFITLLSLGSGDPCGCYVTPTGERYQQGHVFAVGFCYACILDPCPCCPQPLMTSCCDCHPHALPECISTEPVGPLPVCSIFKVFEDFFALLNSLFSIFSPPPVTPPIVTAKRRDVLTNPPGFDRQKQIRDHDFNHPLPVEANDTGVVELTAVLGYDVGDCMTDPVNCVCRNYPTHMKGICTWDYVNSVHKSDKVDNSAVTPDDVLKGLAKQMNKTNPCDWFVQRVAIHGWRAATDVDKMEWARCVDRNTLGTRIHDVANVFPSDYFNREDGILQLIYNIRSAAKAYNESAYNKSHARYTAAKEEAKAKNNGKTDSELYSEHFKRSDEYSKTLNFKNDVIRRFVVRLDLAEYKLRSGILKASVDSAYQKFMKNQHDVSVYDATVHLGRSFYNLGEFAVMTPWRKGVMEGARLTRNVMVDLTEGVQKLGRFVAVNGFAASNPFTYYMKRMRERREENLADKAQADHIIASYYAGPFYKWWSSPWNNFKNPLKPFTDHISRLIRISRRPVTYDEAKTASVNGKVAPTSLLNLDQRMGLIKSAIISRWTPRWKPEIREEWERVGRVFYRMYDFVWPGTLHADIQEKFVIGCNCEVVDKSLGLAIEVIDYCLNDFMFNLPTKTVKKGPLFQYLRDTSPKRKRGFLRDRSTEWNHRNGSEIVWKQSKPGDPLSRFRPKVVHQPGFKQKRFLGLERNQWKRVVQFSTQSYNVYAWFVCQIEDIFGITVGSQLTQFFVDARDWFLNENLNPDECPDNVGAKYWAIFWFRCEFPEYLNGSNPCAVGLKPALKWIFLISLIVFGGVALFLPFVMLPLTVVGAVLFYVIVIPAVAWHYSPACWIIMPGIPIPGIGITIPLIPFPVGLPVLPERLLDDVWELILDFFNACPFQQFEDLIPLCLYSGDICPLTCDGTVDSYINLVNCVNVGISDGISNMIYFFHRLWPEGLDWTIDILGATCVFGGCWIPWLNFEYLQQIRMDILTASPTQACRQEWCAYATIISVPLPLLLILLGLQLLLVVGGVLFELVVALILFGVIVFTPFATQDRESIDYGKNYSTEGMNNEAYDVDPYDVIGSNMSEKKKKKQQKRERVRMRIDSMMDRRDRRIRPSFSVMGSVGEVINPLFSSVVRKWIPKEKTE